MARDSLGLEAYHDQLLTDWIFIFPAIDNIFSQMEGKQDRVMSTKKPSDDDKPAVCFVHRPEDLRGTLKQLGGSQSDQWNTILANQALNSLWTKNSNTENLSKQRSATLSALSGIGPRDEMEGMIAAQLVAAHNAAMECYRRAMFGEQTFEGRYENLNQANKLSRTYAVLLDALNRHRGKGQQKVTVEHVHVHAGGQAVVGTVETRGAGDGQKLLDQPHAKQITHASQSTMRSADKEQDTLPISRDAERSMPHARRGIARRSQG
jgi:hypothetical protein